MIGDLVSFVCLFLNIERHLKTEPFSSQEYKHGEEMVPHLMSF